MSFSADIEKKDFRYWSTTNELSLRYAGSCTSIEMIESETNRYYCFKYFEDTGITDLIEAKSFCKMYYNSTLAIYDYHIQNQIQFDHEMTTCITLIFNLKIKVLTLLRCTVCIFLNDN